jgi:acetoin utilization protein AcuC
VFYAFSDDPELCVVDLHEDGRYLYPGTGAIEETGTGAAAGTKLNIPMPPNADDETFRRVWGSAESFVSRAKPEFILLQCGADSLAGDPITHLEYTAEAHRYATERLLAVAETSCEGRLVAMGGGGYNRANLAEAWTAVVAALLGDGA